MEDRSIRAFLDDLASRAATPGGGSAAAIMGAMGAALVSMVCRLSIGRTGDEAAEGELRAALDEAETWRARLTELIRADVVAVDAVMAAYRLPKGTPEQSLDRAGAVQRALRTATEVPRQCARASAAVIAVCRPAAQKGNRAAIADAGAGALAAHAALRAAALTVRSNAALMTDRAYADSALAELDPLLAASEARVDEIWRLITQKATDR